MLQYAQLCWQRKVELQRCSQKSSKIYLVLHPNNRASLHQHCFNLSTPWKVSFTNCTVSCCYGTAVSLPKDGGRPIDANVPTCCFRSVRVLRLPPLVWL